MNDGIWCWKFSFDIIRVAMSYISYIADFFSEKKCFGCKKSGHFFCPLCSQAIDFYTPYCYFCKKPADNFITHEACLQKICLRQVVVMTRYRSNGIKKLLKHAKFYGKYRAYENLIFSGKDIFSTNIETKNAVLIPIPIPFLRRWKRGYNQTEKIANYLSIQENIPTNRKLLTRKIYAKQQSHLSQSERLGNLVGSFILKNQNIPKESILYLVDDVVSTGATLNEAAKVLQKGGFKDVRAIVLASD